MSAKAFSTTLLDLPDEILVLIVKWLPFPEQANIYESCLRLRLVLTEKNVVRRHLRLGCGPLARPESLHLPFFRNFASVITELDLKLVPELTRTKLIPALKRFTSLMALDISYTKLGLGDLPAICKVCPKLKEICVEISLPDGEQIQDILQQLQRMESIHLVTVAPASTAQYFLRPFMLHCFNKLKKLQFTCMTTQSYSTIYTAAVTETSDKCKAIASYLQVELQHRFPDNWLDGWQYICIVHCEATPKVYMSPTLYKNYQHSYMFSMWDAESTIEHDLIFQHKGKCYMWHKNVVEFNEDFYDRVLREIEKHLINIVCYKKEANTGKVSSGSYYLGACVLESKTDESISVPPTKRQSKCKRVVLNIDKYIEASHNKGIELILCAECYCRIPQRAYSMFDSTVTLDPRSDQMKNVTFLHMQNITSVDAKFFKLLFLQCKRLTTVNIDNASQTMSSSHLCKALSLATSLINLRLREPGISNWILFESLSNCTMLENVHICDLSSKVEKIRDQSLVKFVQKCSRLYCVRIYANFTNLLNQAKNQLKLLKKSASRMSNKAVHMEYINVDCATSYEANINLDGNIDVFFLQCRSKSIHVNLNFPPD